MNMIVLNFPAQALGTDCQSSDKESPQRPELSGHWPSVFVLKTCQRSLLIGTRKELELCLQAQQLNFESASGRFEGARAYRFLLEIICGLQSRLQGENEIVAQFKSAYQLFLQTPGRDTRIQRMLEKLFKDAKQIRTDYLKQIGQYSYAGISRRLLQPWAKHAKPLLVVGSGQLAEDIIKLCRKHYSIVLMARNAAKAQQLAARYQLTLKPWDQLDQAREYAFIVNTVGVEQLTLFDSGFFTQWNKHALEQRLFIDLGQPSVIDTTLSEQHQVIRLNTIFQQVEQLNQKKQQQILVAQQAIEGVVERRWPYLLANLAGSEATVLHSTPTLALV